ncbi:MAG: hypothetical protein ACRD8W_19075 [Nitrososphaeraceae archaeon]
MKNRKHLPVDNDSLINRMECIDDRKIADFTTKFSIMEDGTDIYPSIAN